MAAHNVLLDAIPPDVRMDLDPFMETIELPRGQILHRPGQPIQDVYFPLDAMISVTVTMRDGRTTEVGAIGNREMVGVNAFMGGRETTQTEYVVQIPGTAKQLPADPLLQEFNHCKPLRDVMLRYTQAFIAQLSQNVACNRMHTIEQRLARWLLECRDRLQSENLSLTHEFIAQMLGVRRAGVSEAAAKFQERGLIEYGRKTARILDSPGLEAASCECFEVLRDEYDRLLDGDR
jgi:CRP-like cAMP-binding protein